MSIIILFAICGPEKYNESMRKAIIFILIFTLILTLAACGSEFTVTPTDEPAVETPVPTEEPSPAPPEKEEIAFDTGWTYGEFSEIHSGTAVLYRAQQNRKDIVVGVNAGHGTKGGTSVKTYCHPDKSPKTTGGSTGAGAVMATAVSDGMSFTGGRSEASVTLAVAQFLKDILLENGYDVLMVRDGDDVQLDNVARTVMCNNKADCHVSIHFDGDGSGSDKGAFYISVPDAIKNMEPVKSTWEKSEQLGEALIGGLSDLGYKLFSGGSMDIDLTQTSYSSVPSVDIELGNEYSDISDGNLKKYADGLLAGINKYFS